MILLVILIVALRGLVVVVVAWDGSRWGIILVSIFLGGGREGWVG